MTTLREFIDRTVQYSSNLERLILEGEGFADQFADSTRSSPSDLWLKLVRSLGIYLKMPKEDENLADYAARMLRAPPSSMKLRFGDKEILHRKVIVLPRKDEVVYDWGTIGTIGICERLPEFKHFSFFSDEQYLLRVGDGLRRIDARCHLLAVLEESGRLRYYAATPASTTDWETPTTALEAPEPKNSELEDFNDGMEELLATGKKVSMPVNVPANMPADTPYTAARHFKAANAAKPRANKVAEPAATQEWDNHRTEVRRILHEYFVQHYLYDTLAATRNFLKDYGREGEDLLKDRHKKFYHNFLRFSEVAAIVARQA